MVAGAEAVKSLRGWPPVSEFHLGYGPHRVAFGTSAPELARQHWRRLEVGQVYCSSVTCWQQHLPNGLSFWLGLR